MANLHLDCNETPDLLRRFDKVCIGKVAVARRCAMVPMTKQLADLGQSLARHYGYTCRRVPQVMQT